MSMQDDIRAYQARWAYVETVIAEERRTASLESRWQQLNSAYGMALALGLVREDHSEREVIKRWAKLKEKADPQPPRK